MGLILDITWQTHSGRSGEIRNTRCSTHKASPPYGCWRRCDDIDYFLDGMKSKALDWLM